MILAIDTATANLGLALFDEQRIIAEEEMPAAASHTVDLAPAVEELLRRAAVPTAAIKALAVAQGPGSFTALRIGLAFAAGFALPRNLPVIGVTTFDILAGAVPAGKETLVTIVRAGRGRIAWCEYQALKGVWQAGGVTQVSDWATLAANAPRKALICGEIDRDGRATIEKRRDLTIAPPHVCLRRAGVLAQLAAEKLREVKGRPPLPLPVYLPTLDGAAVESKGHGKEP